MLQNLVAQVKGTLAMVRSSILAPKVKGTLAMVTRSPFTHHPYGESISESVGASNQDDVVVDEAKDVVDVLDSEGRFIMSKERSVVEEKGFFHRGVHVYLFCPKERKVLLGLQWLHWDLS